MADAIAGPRLEEDGEVVVVECWGQEPDYSGLQCEEEVREYKHPLMNDLSRTLAVQEKE